MADPTIPAAPTDPAIAAFEEAVLNQLANSFRAGWETGDLACHIRWRPGNTRRQHSQFVLHLLLDMERRGLIKRLDDQKPIAWQIAGAGAQQPKR